MKKFLAVLIMFVMIFTVTLPAYSVSENESKDYNGYPLVIVRGIDFDGFYLEDKSPAISFGIKHIFSLVKNYFTELIFKRNEDAFIDSALNVVTDVLAPISLDREGNTVYDIYYDKYEKSMAFYSEEVSAMGDIGETGLLKTAVDYIGAENVYYFTYDWRKSAEDMAADLDSFITDALGDSGKSKVNIAAVSMGGMVTCAYLYHHGYDAVNNITYVSSAHNGTYGPGDAFNGDIYFDSDVIFERLRRSSSGNIIASFFLTLADKIGVFDAATALANKIVEDNPQALNNDALRDGFGTLLGLWAMCPDDIFESGVKFIFGGHEKDYPVIMEKLEKTKEFLLSTEEIIDSAIDNGINVTFISNYNSPLSPYFKHSYLQGDGVLETKLTSNFATVAPFGKTLDSEQLSSAEKEFVSPDSVIDATGALYRDATWFVKDARHVATTYGSEYADFVMWLILSDSQPTVKTSSAYPQFMAVDGECNFIS